VVDAGVPPIALVDWKDGETLVAVADGASGLVRREPPVPVQEPCDQTTTITLTSAAS
jgi:hypothetical protein